MSRLQLLCYILLLASCTDTGLYSASTDALSRGDRADFEGTVCVPLASGEAFPVRVLFAVEGGDTIPRDLAGQITTAVDSVVSRLGSSSVEFAMIGYHTIATGLQGGFVPAADFQTALTKYGAYQEAGPVSVRAPLKLAHALLTGDMLSGCRGTVARTRYLVVLIAAHGSSVCLNQTTTGLSAQCGVLPDDQGACSECELRQVALDLKLLEQSHHAGEIAVQPIYVRDVADPLVSGQMAAVARGGGTQSIEVNAGGLQSALNGINYTSLQQALVMKRLIAFNRNSRARAGKLVVDSDGDGLADDEESGRGVDPIQADSDGDGLSDGIEVLAGLNPSFAEPALSGCSALLDTDGDRLNDCEERVLGTDACMGDTDGDGLPDLMEALSATNPQSPEDLADDDRDGTSNADEVTLHADPQSADLRFQDERGYQYEIRAAPPTGDGRACYAVAIRNVNLQVTLGRPNPPFADIKPGNNDVYIYLQVGRENVLRGSGVGSIHIEQILFTPPDKRRPSGTLSLRPDEFLVEN